MSTGGSIPYHLRQNKAIERNLFADLLSRVGRYSNISDFRYIGFGGPFLEDFKHLHSALRISDMISLESDPNVYSRQKFNQPISCIDLRLESSTEFLSNYEFSDDKNNIVWFDYATPEIGQQLSELHRLVEKLGHGDIFKITVNANPATLGTIPEQSKLLDHRAKVASDRLGEYAPAKIDSNHIKTKNYPSLLLSALTNAAKHGLAGDSSLVLQPLSAFSYGDGQQMLTFSGILLHPDEINNFLEKSRLRHWPFYNDCAASPRSISVPALSAKERFYIESMLPGASSDVIHRNLNYHVGQDFASASCEMDNFINFYRQFPWYSKIVL